MPLQQSNTDNNHSDSQDATTNSQRCLLSCFVGLVFLPVGLLYAMLATCIAGYWEVKTWLQNVDFTWDSICENMCGKIICLPLLILKWTLIGLVYMCECLLTMIRVLRAEYRDLMRWLGITQPSSPQARSNTAKPKNLPNGEVQDFLIVRELLSLDSISEPQEAAECFPKHSRDCPDPITVLGDSTLLCFSAPIGNPSDSGGSDDDNKDFPDVGDIPATSWSHNTESETHQSDQDIETGTQSSISDAPVTTASSREATQDSAVKTPDTSCSICLADFKNGDFVAWSRKNLDCPHVYHHHCLLNWLEQRNHCPACRREYQ